ncbi:MAG: hypothetical protein RLZZ621_1411, partial [Gemmatimonadota bacterium]
MKPAGWFRAVTLAVMAVFLVSPDDAAAQEKKGRKDKTPPGDAPKAPKKAPNPRLFRSELPFDVTLTVNLKQIKKDKQADAPWRTAVISYTDSAGKTV